MFAKTEAIYTKHDAVRVMNTKREELGGEWDIEKIHGAKWRAYQLLTREMAERAKAVRQAEIALDPQFDPLNPNALAYGSYRRQLVTLKATLDKFTADFEKDPTYALKYSDKVFLAAAEYKVVSNIIAASEAGHSIEKICAHLEGQVSRSLEFMYLSASSSPTANLIERAEEMAVVKYSKMLRSRIEVVAQARGTLTIL